MTGVFNQFIINNILTTKEIMPKINVKEETRVLEQARKTIEIVKAIRRGDGANKIVQEIGVNYSVASYYIKLLRQD